MSKLDNIIKNLGSQIVESSEKGFGDPEETAKSEMKILVLDMMIESLKETNDFAEAFETLQEKIKAL